MESVTHMVSRVATSRVGPRGRGPRSLPGRARLLVLAVIAADLSWAAAITPGLSLRRHDLLLFAALLACGVATVWLGRRSGEPGGPAGGVSVIWELPVAIHLPLLYALAAPAARLALTYRRDPQAPPWGGVFAAAGSGLAYGCAWLVFHAVIPSPGRYPLTGAWLWLAAAGGCALAQWAVSHALPLIAARAAGARSWTWPGEGPASRESLGNDAAGLAAAILVALAIGVSPLALIVAFPLGTLLQRSYRHAQLLADASADAKTGLLNAAAWEDRAASEVARAVRTGTPLAVALLDLDRFKLINDTYGHLVGDQVLKRIAATMTGVLRDYDLAGRFGGEEFVMLLPQTRAVDALRIADRVRAHIAALPVYASGATGAERVPVTASIGVAALDAGARRELPELLSAADAALYRAKASGRDQVQMISTSRGLSAARPPGEENLFDARRPRDVPPAMSSAVSPVGPQPPELPGVPELPGAGVDAAMSSTATTSALAV